jgi:hypothetical protein
MSGNASLSAAKNRRSGNEVKIHGQPKAMPPPQNTRQVPQAQQRPQSQPQSQSQPQPQSQAQQSQAQQGQAQPQQQQRAPHPMEILKSHELRLRTIEGFQIDQEFAAHMEDYLVFKTNTKKIEQTVSGNNSQVESQMAAMDRRIQELTKLVRTLSQSLSDLQMAAAKKVALPVQESSNVPNISFEISSVA